ncbi:PilZ domain-containing protein [Desulfuromonas sp. AOP6]|uniref:PilZ domain-containing protein n=1 Tax=Desulfuromonas sp. AOP6 TaxID=1566351 RepID=UPI001287F54E|nr:PilZ domain-containing protein [Desulfuromonas sp. AOP6]BCA81136.1 hypothetical protein AOP6_2923 [Desulfuromonas sp. AOP6]
MPKSEQRVFERFEMQMPALIMPQSSNDSPRPLFLLTRDISSGGAYFHTGASFCEKEAVQIEMLIRISLAEKEIHHLYLVTNGEVTRQESSGVAVRFTGEYRLKPFV